MIVQGKDFQSGNDTDSQNDYETSGSGEDEEVSWISWFCSLAGHEYFCEVQEEFIEDDFNLTGLPQIVKNYEKAIYFILDIDINEGKLDSDKLAEIESSADLLYGLIHSRYILTSPGLKQMAMKYDNGDFGICPRHLCNGTYVVPCGRFDQLNKDSVKVFCPSCLDVYNAPSSRFNVIDGAFFGTTFPHLFFNTYPDFLPKEPAGVYIPKMFGFKVSEKSKTGPRIQWLRMLPTTEQEIKEITSTPEEKTPQNA
ncbi:hypothetical protein BB559_006307 [Furculomyces boomerangus]|uniref:Casein kinase II subunit beta n=1 Tax=Furculomyces boomerangus TaxID=61424 RepID=A0A2T9Y3N6_9FUNG|nr:hypothetical protein BB559_006307 [Furculomyces boomerangus]